MATTTKIIGMAKAARSKLGSGVPNWSLPLQAAGPGRPSAPGSLVSLFIVAPFRRLQHRLDDFLEVFLLNSTGGGLNGK
jgi:hypothetical protein